MCASSDWTDSEKEAESLAWQLNLNPLLTGGDFMSFAGGDYEHGRAGEPTAQSL